MTVRALARGGSALDVEYSAIGDLQRYVDAMPEAATTAARIALNDVVSGEGLAIYRKAVDAEIEFPPGYINDDRLGIGQRATVNNLAVSVVGRFRPTSLARFVQQGNAPGQYGVKVQVKRGSVRTIKRGFLIKLRNGNQGLAVRVRKGERLTSSTGAKKLGDDLYLLYGPSVDQVFRSTAGEATPGVLDKVCAEFFRQFFRLAK